MCSYKSNINLNVIESLLFRTKSKYNICLKEGTREYLVIYTQQYGTLQYNN